MQRQRAVVHLHDVGRSILLISLGTCKFTRKIVSKNICAACADGVRVKRISQKFRLVEGTQAHAHTAHTRWPHARLLHVIGTFCVAPMCCSTHRPNRSFMLSRFFFPSFFNYFYLVYLFFLICICSATIVDDDNAVSGSFHCAVQIFHFSFSFRFDQIKKKEKKMTKLNTMNRVHRVVTTTMVALAATVAASPRH